MGKLCESKGTPKGLIADYMKHLKLHHNYSSLKMQYQQDEFPLLSGPRQLSDGFGHMVEKADEDEEMRPNSQDDPKDIRIAELQAQLSDHNVVRQKLIETNAKLDALKKENRARTCDLPLDFFDYDEEKDEVHAVDEMQFDKFVDSKCKATQDREAYKDNLKNKILEQVKQTERRKRGLSISSAVSIAFSDESGRIRQRSGSDGGGDSKHSRLLPNQTTA